MNVDFHLHTSASDGAHEPARIAAAAAEARLVRWAITDHDSMAGWRTVAGAPGLVPGVEVTGQADDREIHVVGLGIDPDDAAFAAFLAAIRATREQRMRALMTRLGIAERITLDELRVGAESVGRNHLARALVALGVATSFNDAFARHLGDEHLADTGLAPYPALADVCAAIRAARGVAILAHPGIYVSRQAVEALVAHGCDGLETAHPKLAPSLAGELRQMATRANLLQSCGSDLHVLGTRQPGEHRLSRAVLAPLIARLDAA
ncbi:MAG TPA: hypothetical protein VEL07_15505 [Planctomycetota bacterium]|nr:hypothetical protein [Planctomycetota bacterium]